VGAVGRKETGKKIVESGGGEGFFILNWGINITIAVSSATNQLFVGHSF